MKQVLMIGVAVGALLLLSACATITTQPPVAVEESNLATDTASGEAASPESLAEEEQNARVTDGDDQVAVEPLVGQDVSIPSDGGQATSDEGVEGLDEVDWRSMPIIPEISANALSIYKRGIQMGNNPRSFSVLGECQSELAWETNGVLVQGFMTGFEDPANYTLGDDYARLQETIDYFDPSWTQERVAAHRGTNVAQVLSPLYSDAELCDVRESPLTCEIRRNNPSIVFISFETWFYDRPIASYETYMRQILDHAIAEGVLPVLVTTPDSHDQSRDINQVLGELAVEYDIPLWNYWAAVQPLPGNGLESQPDENGFKHLTYGLNDFADPDSLQTAWTVRNLNGLQVLETLRLAVDDYSS